MGRVLRRLLNQKNEHLGYTFPCPGCKTHHAIHTERKATNGAIWGFDGNTEKPTFTPSILTKWGFENGIPKNICHSFIRKGIWEFLNDCTHELAGQKVPMIEIED